MKKQKEERDDHLLFEATVIDSQRDKFRIMLQTGQEIVATLSGKLRMNKIRIVAEDKVMVAVSKYDLSRGIIKSRI